MTRGTWTKDRIKQYLTYSVERPQEISPARWRAILKVFKIDPDHPVCLPPEPDPDEWLTFMATEYS